MKKNFIIFRVFIYIVDGNYESGVSFCNVALKCGKGGKGCVDMTPNFRKHNCLTFEGLLAFYNKAQIIQLSRMDLLLV